jgi:DNA-binding MarR family transcriptional regulator
MFRAAASMERQHERDLEILTAIEEGEPLTQRALAKRLGVALGLANLYLKRLAKKGSIKIVEFPKKAAARKRLRYLLTPTGMAEKTRLTYEHMAYSLNLYRRARQTLRESLSQLPERGAKRIALYGTGEAAEVAYLTLRELGLEPIGVFADEAGGDFLGFPVRGLEALAGEDHDAVIVATFERPEPALAELGRRGLARDRIVTLRRPEEPAPSHKGAL